MFNLIFFSVLWQLLPHYTNPCLCKPLIIVFLCHNVGKKNITWEANSLGKYSVLNFQSRAPFFFLIINTLKKQRIEHPMIKSNFGIKISITQVSHYPSITNTTPPPRSSTKWIKRDLYRKLYIQVDCVFWICIHLSYIYLYTLLYAVFVIFVEDGDGCLIMRIQIPVRKNKIKMKSVFFFFLIHKIFLYTQTHKNNVNIYYQREREKG